MKRKEYDFYGKKLIFETGRVAKQANGSALITLEDTVLLSAATASATAREDQDFFPLTVNYKEKTYAAGKIPGGFFKREGRPSTKEILTSRLTDRALRPMFPDDFKNETQIALTVLSSDAKNEGSVLTITGASLALLLSDIPFPDPLASVRVGKLNGELVINPNYKDIKDCDIDLMLAGTATDVVMIESAATEASNEEMLEAIAFGHTAIKKLIEFELEFIEGVTKEKMDYPRLIIEPELEKEIISKHRADLKAALMIFDKKEREHAVDAVYEAATSGYKDDEDKIKQIFNIFEKLEQEVVRDTIIEGVRVDGRKTDEIRPITCEVGVLPRTHGSALFTRGQTQSLGIVTLGTVSDSQIIDGLEEDTRKRFLMHYNFPSFSVGEVRPDRGPSRREIGHGALAEKALTAMLPEPDAFPYTIRVVSEILESNGSSSMATVCSGSLSLMNAGVPLKKSVAGIAMGLVKKDDAFTILTDIQGLEDHYGDMDFKVAGTRDGITALQMDIKVKGLSMDIMKQALEQAQRGRLHILDIMDGVISSPSDNLSKYAPKIIQMHVPKDKIRQVIGAGGKVINKMIEDFEVQINIDDDGVVTIYGEDQENLTRTQEKIKQLTFEMEPGEIYDGFVDKIMPYGAFIEVAPGVSGLCHISRIADHRINRVEDVLTEGQNVRVKCLEVDSQGRAVLSIKDAR